MFCGTALGGTGSGGTGPEGTISEGTGSGSISSGRTRRHEPAETIGNDALDQRFGDWRADVSGLGISNHAVEDEHGQPVDECPSAQGKFFWITRFKGPCSLARGDDIHQNLKGAFGSAR